MNTAFENLEFETGSDVIAGSSYESLDELAALLVKKPEYRLRMPGHTDNVGSESSNLRLSEKRSKSVLRYLSNKGLTQATSLLNGLEKANRSSKRHKEAPEEQKG